MELPAGWFRVSDGRLRYWNGVAWTSHFSDAVTLRPGTYRTSGGRRVEWNGSRWSDGLAASASASAPATRVRAAEEHVWMLVDGATYHRQLDCPGLAASPRTPDPVSIDEVGSAKRCIVCWQEEPRNSEWGRLVERVAKEGDSRFERFFVTSVLQHVEGLLPEMVRPQVDAVGRSGRRYRVDFVIQAGSSKETLRRARRLRQGPRRRASADSGGSSREAEGHRAAG